jgi:hypothetical protein
VTDETDHEDEKTGRADGAERSTAPQSAYTGREVLIGAAIAALGVAVTFGTPLAVGL